MTADDSHGISIAEIYGLLGVAPASGGSMALIRLNTGLKGRVNKWSRAKPVVPRADAMRQLTADQRRETADGTYYGLTLVAPATHDLTALRSWSWTYTAPTRGRHWCRLSDWLDYHHTVGPYPQVVPTDGCFGFNDKTAPMDVTADSSRAFRLTLRLASDEVRRAYGVNCIAALVGEQWDRVATSLRPVLVIGRGDTCWARAMQLQGTGAQTPVDMSSGPADLHYYTSLDLPLTDAGGLWMPDGSTRPYCRAWLQAVGCYGGTGTDGEFLMAESLKAVLTQSTLDGQPVYMAVVLVNLDTLHTDLTVEAPDPSGGAARTPQPLDLARWVPLHRLTGGAIGVPCIPVPVPYGSSGGSYRCWCPVHIRGAGQMPSSPRVSVTAARVSNTSIRVTATLGTSATAYDHTFWLSLVFRLGGGTCQVTRPMHVATGRDDLPDGSASDPVTYVIYPADLGLEAWPAGSYSLDWRAYGDPSMADAALVSSGTIDTI